MEEAELEPGGPWFRHRRHGADQEARGRDCRVTVLSRSEEHLALGICGAREHTFFVTDGVRFDLRLRDGVPVRGEARVVNVSCMEPGDNQGRTLHGTMRIGLPSPGDSGARPCSFELGFPDSIFDERYQGGFALEL